VSRLSATIVICCSLAASAFVGILVQIWTTFKASSYCAMRHLKFLMYVCTFTAQGMAICERYASINTVPNI